MTDPDISIPLLTERLAARITHREGADQPDIHREVLRLCLAIAEERQHPDATVCTQLALLLAEAGFHTDAAQLLETACRSPSRDGRDRALLLNQRGLLAVNSRQADAAEAATLFERAHAECQDQDPELAAQICANLASLALREGSVEQASHWAELAQTAPCDTWPAVLDLTLAKIELGIARYRADREHYDAAAARLARATARRIGELNAADPRCLVLIGELAAVRAVCDQAEGSYDQAETATEVLRTAALKLAAHIGADHPRALALTAASAAAEMDLAIRFGPSAYVADAATQLEALFGVAERIWGAQYTTGLRSGPGNAASGGRPARNGNSSHEELIARLGVDVDATLLDQALTLRSYAHENGDLPANDRMEFLGDSVLGLVVTDLLYKTYSGLAEGQLAKLRSTVVNSNALAEVARGLALGEHVKLGSSEEARGGRDRASILADTLEALIGAVYLGHGIEAAFHLVERLFGPLITASAHLDADGDGEASALGFATGARPAAPTNRLVRILIAARRPAAEVEALDIAAIRRERGEALREETELSYLRRVLHTRIDIVDAEMRRRAATSTTPLAQSLAGILADEPAANARSPRHVDIDIMPEPDPGEYRSLMEERIHAVGPAIVLDLSDTQLAEARLTLKAYEREVSEYRRIAQAVIDRFAAELARRYREGQATVDDQLTEETSFRHWQ